MLCWHQHAGLELAGTVPRPGSGGGRQGAGEGGAPRFLWPPACCLQMRLEELGKCPGGRGELRSHKMPFSQLLECLSIYPKKRGGRREASQSQDAASGLGRGGHQAQASSCRVCAGPAAVSSLHHAALNPNEALNIKTSHPLRYHPPRWLECLLILHPYSPGFGKCIPSA